MEPTNFDKMRGLPWSIGGSMSIAVFNQFTFFGSGYVLFLTELGFNKAQTGFLLSLLSFLGTLAVFAPPLISRLGYKRAFVNFWTARNLVPAFFLLIPWVLTSFGVRTVLLFTAAVVMAFGFFRTVAETALLSWQQEYIPRSIQGKFFATNNIFVSLVSVGAVAIAGYIIGRSSELSRFALLFGMGVCFGVLSAWSFLHVPGGIQSADHPSTQSRLAGMRSALQDRDFLFFLVGVGLVVVGVGSLGSFLPLYMRDKVGLENGRIVFLQTGTLLGGLFASYAWGWAADRYGSKPVMLSGIYLLALLPVCWFLMPRMSALSFPIALAIAFLQGIASLGWGIGMSRLFFVSMVPPEKKSDYMALYYSWISITSGLSTLAGGWILDRARDIDGQVLFASLDAYSWLFAIGLFLPLISVIFFSTVRSDSSITTRQFAGLFLRGNPLLALGSLISFQTAIDERSTVSTTARLGQAQSPLTVDELLSALEDPRFNVRLEAVISIARRGPDDRLMEALTGVLLGKDPALSVIAAWAMGRIGDERAIGPLRLGLDSTYRSVQGHCARSLGVLNDQVSSNLLIERLRNEKDSGLQLAYASALGHLSQPMAARLLLELLDKQSEKIVQRELVLALVRILGNEPFLIHLLRQIENEPGSALARAAADARSHLQRAHIEDLEILSGLNQAAELFARENLAAGSNKIAEVSKQLLQVNLRGPSEQILAECFRQLEGKELVPMHYLLLAMCTLNNCETDQRS